jgi:hypothetical protein
MKRKVHITDLEGSRLYNRLWDDGSNVLAFDSGYGFVDRTTAMRNGWIIRDGWQGGYSPEFLRIMADAEDDAGDISIIP